MHRKMNEAHEGEARAILSAKAKIVGLEKKYQAKNKDLRRKLTVGSSGSGMSLL